MLNKVHKVRTNRKKNVLLPSYIYTRSGYSITRAFKYGAFNIQYPVFKISRNKLRDISLKVLLKQLVVFENSAQLSLLRP
jgi:hypothetical protein